MPILYNSRNKMIPHRFTIEQIEEADKNYGGFCIACGAEASGVEPDARKYECEECDHCQVYGASEIAIMGLVV